jgi:hypothetical protein
MNWFRLVVRRMTNDPIVELTKLRDGGSELLMTDLQIGRRSDGSYYGVCRFELQKACTCKDVTPIDGQLELIPGAKPCTVHQVVTDRELLEHAFAHVMSGEYHRDELCCKDLDPRDEILRRMGKR